MSRPLDARVRMATRELEIAGKVAKTLAMRGESRLREPAAAKSR